jgi:hypothetical protein
LGDALKEACLKGLVAQEDFFASTKLWCEDLDDPVSALRTSSSCKINITRRTKSQNQAKATYVFLHILIVLVFLCYLSMFNALSGMGGGRQENDQAMNETNAALNTTFAMFGILGSEIYNICSVR